jgi:hypothetical protein
MPEDLVSYLKGYISTTASMVGRRFDEQDVRRLFGALNRLSSRVRYQANEVPRLGSIDYMHLLIGNIVSGKYMTGYAEYNPRYKAWKQNQTFTNMGYWRLSSDLINSFTRYRVPIAKGKFEGQYAWFSGVPAGVMDSGNKSWFSGLTQGAGDVTCKRKEISKYGAIMERGGIFAGQTHLARPIFKPTLLMYGASGFKTRGAEALQSLKRYWGGGS